MDLNQKLVGVVRTVKASVKADEDSNEKKSVTLVLDYSDCTLADVLTKAAAHDRIAWQNGGQGRKSFSKIVNGSTINVKASRPGAIDPVQAEKERFQAMTPEQRAEHIANLKKLAGIA